MEVLLGGLSSILYGVADFLGGEGARRAPAASIVVWAGVVSFPAIAVAAVVVGGDAEISDFLIGGLAGGAGALGLVALFAGLSRGRAAVVAPLAAAISAVIPVVVAIVEGERQSTLGWIGLAIAIPAITLCAWTIDAEHTRSEGVWFGVAAGLGFGAFTVVIRLTDPTSGLYPLVASRGATMLVVAGVGLLGLWKVVGFSRVPRAIVLGNAVGDVTANVTLLMALRAGSLALAAVAASFYPAVTVILARAINKEHLLRRQVAGLVLTLVSMGLIAA